jgi:hypothetical protein
MKPFCINFQMEDIDLCTWKTCCQYCEIRSFYRRLLTASSLGETLSLVRPGCRLPWRSACDLCLTVNPTSVPNKAKHTRTTVHILASKKTIEREYHFDCPTFRSANSLNKSPHLRVRSVQIVPPLPISIMAPKALIPLLVTMMLVTGVCNTLLTKYQVCLKLPFYI